MAGMTALSIEEFEKVNRYVEEKRLERSRKVLRPLELLDISKDEYKVGGKTADLAEIHFPRLAKLNDWFLISEITLSLGLKKVDSSAFSRNLTQIALREGYKISRRTVYSSGIRRKSFIQLKFDKD